ncbi:sialate O-acetylesterase [Sphingomonas sp. NFX23]|uniref:sialate O-acetylesterase n=1 Tax=Sphingomonas sp. NFX23 TaxID=2819532 RepID=UPI003CF6504E
MTVSTPDTILPGGEFPVAMSRDIARPNGTSLEFGLATAEGATARVGRSLAPVSALLNWLGTATRAPFWVDGGKNELLGADGAPADGTSYYRGHFIDWLKGNVVTAAALGSKLKPLGRVVYWSGLVTRSPFWLDTNNNELLGADSAPVDGVSYYRGHFIEWLKNNILSTKSLMSKLASLSTLFSWNGVATRAPFWIDGASNELLGADSAPADGVSYYRGHFVSWILSQFGTNLAGVKPTGYILIWAIGQSNTAGRAMAKSPQTFEPGQAYKYVRSAANLDLLADPTGNDGTAIADPGRGSSLPAMAKAIQRASRGKIGVIVVNSASGGTSLLTGWADNGSNWNQAKADLTRALADAAAKKLPIVGACTVMQIGETDGDNAVATSTWVAAGKDLKARHDAFMGPKVPLLMIRIGTKNTGDTPEYAAIRAAQNSLAATETNMHLVHTGTKYFAERNLMMDSFHYVIAGYEEIGEAAGIAAFEHSLGARPLNYND